jgi:hypothetical protein
VWRDGRRLPARWFGRAAVIQGAGFCAPTGTWNPSRGASHESVRRIHYRRRCIGVDALLDAVDNAMNFLNQLIKGRRYGVTKEELDDRAPPGVIS